jgi:hypothetical protein
MGRYSQSCLRGFTVDISRRVRRFMIGSVLRKGSEEYVVKDERSPYRGGVTRSWLKVKVPG